MKNSFKASSEATEAFVALERLINRKMAEEEIKTVAEKILEQKSASEIVRTPEAVRKISKEEVEDVFKSLKQQNSEQPLVDKVIDNIVDDIVKGKNEDEDFELLDEEEIKSKLNVFELFLLINSSSSRGFNKRRSKFELTREIPIARACRVLKPS